MASVLHFTILFIAVITGKVYADREEEYYSSQGAYNPLYNSENYELYNSIQEPEDNLQSLLYQRYYSPLLSALYPEYLRSLYENELENVVEDTDEEQNYATYLRGLQQTNNNNNDDEVDEDDENTIVAAVDLKGDTYLLSKELYRTLRTNGLVSEDGSLLVPNGALRVEGEEAVDENSGRVAYVLPEESLRNIESDNVVAISDDDTGAYGGQYGYRSLLSSLLGGIGHPGFEFHRRHHGGGHRRYRRGYLGIHGHHGHLGHLLHHGYHGLHGGYGHRHHLHRHKFF